MQIVCVPGKVSISSERLCVSLCAEVGVKPPSRLDFGGWTRSPLEKHPAPSAQSMTDSPSECPAAFFRILRFSSLILL